jgi:phenylacetate-CoA ligase
LINSIIIHATLWCLWIVRKVISLDSRAYMILSAPWLQTTLARIGMLRAQAVYLKASETCPAYRSLAVIPAPRDDERELR